MDGDIGIAACGVVHRTPHLSKRKGRREDGLFFWMAEGAVRGEPVSAVNSLKCWKNTGKLAVWSIS